MGETSITGREAKKLIKDLIADKKVHKNHFSKTYEYRFDIEEDHIKVFRRISKRTIVIVMATLHLRILLGTIMQGLPKTLDDFRTFRKEIKRGWSINGYIGIEEEVM